MNKDKLYNVIMTIMIIILIVLTINLIRLVKVGGNNYTEVNSIVNNVYDEEVLLTITGKGEVKLTDDGIAYKFIELTKMNKETERHVAFLLGNEVSGDKVIKYSVVVTEDDYNNLDEWILIGRGKINELNTNIRNEYSDEIIQEVKDVIAGQVK